MIHAQEGAIAMTTPQATIATNATHSLVFDTKDFDYATIDLQVGTHATNGGDLSVCKLVEHSSVTSFSSMTAIIDFTGGTEVSDSVGFVIPDDEAMGPGAIIEFQVDLRKRERMLGLVVTSGTTALSFASLAKLTRSKESADTEAEKSSVTIHSQSSATAVAKIVRG